MDKRSHWLWVSLPLLLVAHGASSYLTVPEQTLCEPGSRPPVMLKLDSSGKDSAALVEMYPGRHCLRRPVVVVAPAGHMLALRLVSKEASAAAGSWRRRGDCSLQVMSQHGQQPVSLDLCNRSSLGRVLMMGVYPFRHTAVLTWSVSEEAAASLQASAILLTVVSKGSKSCSRPGMVPCISEGESPLLCVSSELMCDTYLNCPVTGFDEDPSLCLPEETPANVADHDVDHLQDSADSLANALAHYGPWGYLMLGTLLCGALLMVCGLWECCCRGSKVNRRFPASPANQTPTVYVISQAGATAPAQETTETVTAPPNYEELDQPPDYKALFPVDKDQPKRPSPDIC